MSAPEGEHARAVQRLLAEARAAHESLLPLLPEALRASLPVDATGITQAIDALAGAVGLDETLRAERDRLNRANPAVLHGRVFGRAPLSPETVTAAFEDAARARRGLLTRLAEAIDGRGLRLQVEAVLDAHPPERELAAAYAAQEDAVLLCAARLDEVSR